MAVLTLALGIAANATVFGWIDTLLVRPFPGVDAGGRLAALETVSPSGEYSGTRCWQPWLRYPSGSASRSSSMRAEA